MGAMWHKLGAMLGGMIAVLVTACIVAALAIAPAQAAPNGRVCGLIRADIPYSRDPHGGQRWRVYVYGAASCHTAERALDAVMHLHGVNHSNGFEDNSYVTYRGWSCPYGQMGTQVCFLGTPSKPRVQASALDCSVVKCPVDKAPSF